MMIVLLLMKILMMMVMMVMVKMMNIMEMKVMMVIEKEDEDNKSLILLGNLYLADLVRKRKKK